MPESKPHKAPTEKQYAYLRALSVGAIIVGAKRETEMYLRRGWVTADHRPEEKHYPYCWIRITPDGLRALAEGVERYGLPELGPSPKKGEHYCGDCDSRRIYWRLVDVDIPVPA